MILRQSFQRPFIQFAVLAALTIVSALPSSAEDTIAPINGMVGVGTWKTQAEFKDIRVTKGNKTLFASDFSKGKESLEGWKIREGEWEVVDGALRQTSDEEGTRALVGDPAWTEYTLTLKARKLSGSEGFIVFFGVPDESVRSSFNVGGWDNTASAIQAPSIPDERVPGKIETGRWYDIKIELEGSKVRAYLDNKLIQTASREANVFTTLVPPHTVEFSTADAGKKMPLTQWGLDTSWPSPENMWRGIAYMGKEHVDMVGVSFPINEPLVNGDLPASKDEHFTKRIVIANMAGDKPWTMVPDTEAGIHPWYKKGNVVIPERWVELMAVSQRKYGKKMLMIEPFNEPDYRGWRQGGVENLNDILEVMRKHPEFDGVELGGPSTLNPNAARPWYNVINDHVHWGTTHALAGNMENYIHFYETAVADGKIAQNPEVHNVCEVISGAEYGMEGAIWWGTAELARGEFVKASDGVRLAYAEDRPRWTSAAVYRAPDGEVQAFVGGSERMAATTSYRFVATDRAVFFDGHGPQREYTVTVPGGLGYWANQISAERVVNITWGEDVQPPVDGRYVILNRLSGKVLGVAGANKGNGARIQQMDYAHETNQQWDVAPFKGHGDLSYFTVKAVHSGKSLDIADWNNAEGGEIQQWGEGDSAAQQWYLEYAGDNCFYIRSRWTTKCLGIAADRKDDNVSVQQFAFKDEPNLKWRLIPVEDVKPADPEDEEEASEPASKKVEEPIFDFDPPQAPAGLTASAKPDGVELQWEANSDADLLSYTVLRSTTKAGPYDTVARGVKDNKFTDSEAKAGQVSYYVIRAVDRSLNRSPFSPEASAAPGK